MQTLQTVALATGIIAYAAMTFMAAFAFHRLRHQSDDIRSIKYVLFKVFAIVSAMKLQGLFDQIEKMRTALSVLVQKEKYAEAAKMKAAIEEQEKEAMESLKAFSETFGDTAEVSVTKIPL